MPISKSQADRQNYFPQLLTPTQAAQFLVVPMSRIRHLVFEKKIPFVKMGRSVRFDRGDLVDWIESMKRKSRSLKKPPA